MGTEMRKTLLATRVAATAILLVLLIDITVAATVPLKSEGGAFVVSALINDKIALDFMVDSGAAEVSIPVDVFLTLRRTNTVKDDDALTPGIYMLADGSTREEIRFRIHSLRIGDLELRDVAASVSPVKGNLLLGQSFLSRVRTWSIDNQRHLLSFDQEESLQTRYEPSPGPAEATGYRATPDYSCGAAQNLCRDGAKSLCRSYREDFRKANRICPGVYDGQTLQMGKRHTLEKSTPVVGEHACGAARNICRDGFSSLCESYRNDFQRAGRTCNGVTDSNR